MTISGIFTTIFRSISDFTEVLREARSAQDVYFNLSAMSDEGLERRGIKRHEIASIALKQISTGGRR